MDYKQYAPREFYSPGGVEDENDIQLTTQWQNER